MVNIIQVYHYGYWTGSLWDEEVKNIQEAALAINKMQPKPKFLVIGGDILNAFPGEVYKLLISLLYLPFIINKKKKFLV